MKKLLTLTFINFLLIYTSVFASEVSDLLDKAKSEYEKENISASITCIDSARKILDKESLNKTETEYIEIINWDVVKVKKTEYLGKKIKIKTRFYGINSDGTIHLAIGLTCPYENSLINKLLELTKYQEYTFYGTVIENNSILGPMLHIEAID